ncbi:MAG TPA: hypothetical protein VIK22_15065 [Candidatus Anoxymicrobiaceae bacterium]
MALFDEQLDEVLGLFDAWRESGDARELAVEGREPWPDGPSLVLLEDTALELGNPALASLSMLLWSDPDGIEDGRVTLVGPDINEALDRESIPFAQVVIAAGTFENEYDSYREIRDAVYDTRLVGLSVRTMPSKQTLWCRVGLAATEEGFSLRDLGAALIDSLKKVEEVTGAEVLFVTSHPQDVQKLAPAAASAQRLIDAMMKMYQEQNFDCETCDYQDVCDTVMDLKKIRSKLAESS